jgi:hypothetical protein
MGRGHPGRNPDAPPRFGRTPYRLQAPTTAEKHTVTYTRRPIIRYTLKRVFFVAQVLVQISERLWLMQRAPRASFVTCNTKTGVISSISNQKNFFDKILFINRIYKDY